MDYQISLACGQLAEWHTQLQDLAEAHRGQPAGDQLKVIAQEVYESVPAAWWATRPVPVRH